MRTKLLTKEIHEQLLKNGRLRQQSQMSNQGEPDFLPVVKLFTPDGAATWLLTEIHPDDHDIAFGLCDPGIGCPELGCVSLAEIAAVRGVLNLPVERDLHFVPRKTIRAYAAEARRLGRIDV